MHEEVCPSGPTAWVTMKMFELGKNIGYEIDGEFGFKKDGNFSELQKRTWEFVRNTLDQGLPCYGWELEIPEFYVVYGYDEVGYYYSGPGSDEGKGPKPWQELGDTGIGLIEMYNVKPAEAADDHVTVKESLSFVRDHAGNPEEWIFPNYRAGLGGFDNWIGALEGGKAGRFGMGYNAALWAECRRYAVDFLKEARDRVGNDASGLFFEAIDHYQLVSQSLEDLAQTYPFSPDAPQSAIAIDDTSKSSVEILKAAREAEAAGLEVLNKIISEL
jgi:hypothetical protein